MAMTTTVKKRGMIGGFRIAMGTFTNGDTDTGGTVDTGIKNLFFFSTSVDSHVGSTVIKHTITAGSSNVTIVCNDGVDGRWIAIGM